MPMKESLTAELRTLEKITMTTSLSKMILHLQTLQEVSCISVLKKAEKLPEFVKITKDYQNIAGPGAFIAIRTRFNAF